MAIESRVPLADVITEARRIVEVAEAYGVTVRVAGGVAVRLLAPRGVPDRFLRTPQDIDLVMARGASNDLASLMTTLGYAPDREFNALNGRRRLLFHDEANQRQVDVFVGSFVMCHELPIAARLEISRQTLPLAELLLMKLQIYEINPKDQLDVVTLLLFHPLADHDDGAINASYVAALCAQDWGLWRTATLNLERLEIAPAVSSLTDDERSALNAQIACLQQHLLRAPKSRRWRLRSRVGDRVRWYELPEEVS